ncbi:MAG: hypothetical protein GC168_11995 [Candidatus Hydrogenedens sp.]|nr:hypothetical protein [Candidatus Hydrogenedens sp.]
MKDISTRITNRSATGGFWQACTTLIVLCLVSINVMSCAGTNGNRIPNDTLPEGPPPHEYLDDSRSVSGTCSAWVEVGAHGELIATSARFPTISRLCIIQKNDATYLIEPRSGLIYAEILDRKIRYCRVFGELATNAIAAPTQWPYDEGTNTFRSGNFDCIYSDTYRNENKTRPSNDASVWMVRLASGELLRPPANTPLYPSRVWCEPFEDGLRFYADEVSGEGVYAEITAERRIVFGPRAPAELQCVVTNWTYNVVDSEGSPVAPPPKYYLPANLDVPETIASGESVSIVLPPAAH